MSAHSPARERLATLTSGIGAAVLGAGVGALFPDALGRIAILLLVAGGLLHGWGMYDRMRMERTADARPPWWSSALYWICWGALAALALYLALGRLD